MEQDDYQQTLATGIQAGDENDSMAQKIMNGGRTILQAMVYPVHDDLANNGFQEQVPHPFILCLSIRMLIPQRVDAIPDKSCLLKTPKNLPDCRVARYTKPGASLFMVSHTVMTPPIIVSGEEQRCFADAEDVPYVRISSV